MSRTEMLQWLETKRLLEHKEGQSEGSEATNIYRLPAIKMDPAEVELYTGKDSRVVRVSSESGVKAVKLFLRDDSAVSIEMSMHKELSAEIPGLVSHLCNRFEYPRIMELEYCSSGSLRHYILSRGDSHFFEQHLIKMFHYMLDTVYQLHKKRIVHKALSVDNFLVTSEDVVKLTDLGNIKLIEMGNSVKVASYCEDSSRVYTTRIFAHEALMLGKVFLQMVTFNFDIPTMQLTQDMIRGYCRNLRYTQAVEDIIVPLYFQEYGGRGEQVVRQLHELMKRAQLDNPEDVMYLWEPGHLVCFNCLKLTSRVVKLQCECSVCESCLNSQAGGRYYCYPCKKATSEETFEVLDGGLTSATEYIFA